MSGPGVIPHNRRTYTAANVDRERTKDNIEYFYRDIKEVYHELFDEALKEYNAKQTRKDRVIDDYYKKICSGKQEKPFYELIFQIGNKDDMAVGTTEGDKAKEILTEFMQGFEGEGKSDNERNLWIESEKEALAAVMKKHGIAWERKGTHLEHLDVLNFKKEQRAKELAELEQCIEQLTPEVQNMEMVVAEFCQDPEKQLPEAAPFESAKSYRAKVKPLFEKMANMILYLAATVVRLKKQYGELEIKYYTEKDKVGMLNILLKDKKKKSQKEKNRFHGEKSF